MTELYTDLWRWKWRRRDLKRERKEVVCSHNEVFVDPLDVNKKRGQLGVSRCCTIVETSSVEASPFIDPLGATRDEGICSSLNQVESISREIGRHEVELTNTLISSDAEYIIKEPDLPGFEPWSAKRKAILDEFTASEKLSIISTFLPNGVPLNTRLCPSDRAAHRLEQLNDTSGLKKLADLSQEEYVCNVNELGRKLMTAWANQKKVESVKIAVELSRILASTASPHFYPTQFVLVTDILDVFGELVFERLRSKANAERIEAGLGPLPVEFLLDDVPETTQETAKNWFYKIGDIRELLPRFYVEAAIMGCMRFLDDKALSANLLRLCAMPLSMVHPLVASYARAYLCRIAIRLCPSNTAPHWKCINDWMQNYSDQPSAILLPAMEWMIQCVSYKAHTYDDLLPLWEYCKMPDKRPFVLRCFLSSVTAGYICEYSLETAQIVCSGEEVAATELCIFGKRLLMADVPEASRRPVLRNVWRQISKLTSVRGFVDCCDVWIEYVVKYFTWNEVGVVLNTLMEKLAPDKKYENFYEKLLSIWEKLLANSKDVSELFSLEQIPSFVDVFRNSEAMVKCSMIALSTLVKVHPIRFSNDFRLAVQILGLCRHLHDSISSMSEESEKDIVASLIQRSLDRFDLEVDPERSLDFWVDSRAALSNIDPVITYIIKRVISLGYSVIRRKAKSVAAASFLRACVANAFITVASLSDPVDQVQLYIQTGMLGLLVSSLPQVDATAKCAIEVLSKIKRVVPSTFASLSSSLLAFLVLVPDSPARPPLYFFNAFLNAIARYPWKEDSADYGHILINSLLFISILGQPELPYHIAHVQSNDQLYGGCDEFMKALDEKADVVMSRLEAIVDENTVSSHKVAIALCETIVSIGKIDEMAELLVQILNRLTRGDLKPWKKGLLNSLMELSKRDQMMVKNGRKLIAIFFLLLCLTIHLAGPVEILFIWI
ncbi:hypothetical protein AB6A40_009330 [Gnathostoma spinigerum]|uniref:Uncharacterized protein n=1 Tax=Gnathostoma spinigerum TaxID=75299 RepID=A0ABD6ETI5_9BILA